MLAETVALDVDVADDSREVLQARALQQSV